MLVSSIANTTGKNTRVETATIPLFVNIRKPNIFVQIVSINAKFVENPFVDYIITTRMANLIIWKRLILCIVKRDSKHFRSGDSMS